MLYARRMNDVCTAFILSVVALRMSIVVTNYIPIVFPCFRGAALVYWSCHVEPAFRFFSRIIWSSPVDIIGIFAVERLLQLLCAVEIVLLLSLSIRQWLC